MKAYGSNREYFDELLSLAARMEQSGHAQAASEVRSGLAGINGLTDGWAILMDSLEKTIAEHGTNLPTDQVSDLESAFEAARKIVFRP